MVELSARSMALVIAAKDEKISKLVEALRKNNHHLARLVNGNDSEVDWEAARQQVLVTREFLNNEGKSDAASE